MNKWRNLLAKIEFHFLLAILTVLAFVWPFLVTPNLTNNQFVFTFLYGSWIVVIIAHFFMDRFSVEDESEDNQ